MNTSSAARYAAAAWPSCRTFSAPALRCPCASSTLPRSPCVPAHFCGDASRVRTSRAARSAATAWSSCRMLSSPSLCSPFIANAKPRACWSAAHFCGIRYRVQGPKAARPRNTHKSTNRTSAKVESAQTSNRTARGDFIMIGRSILFRNQDGQPRPTAGGPPAPLGAGLHRASLATVGLAL